MEEKHGKSRNGTNFFRHNKNIQKKKMDIRVNIRRNSSNNSHIPSLFRNANIQSRTTRPV
jgi:hypothetical protein